MNTKNIFCLSKITCLTLFAAVSTVTYAEEQNDTELETIQVQGTRSNSKKKYDVTGLGAIKKTAAKLQSDQVENIRDLTRYDPDIGVNEAGGRGTSRGFSIRGVERERVAIDVDGFGSAPVFKRDSATSGTHRVQETSGSINETEYENLKEVDIRKGSASAESGNGALGGSVSMVTKDASDFLSGNRQFGGRLKLGYTSKDKRNIHSAAIAGRHKGLEGFIQYTGRSGHEVQAHRELYQTGDTVKYYSPGTGSSTTLYLSADELSGPKRRVPNPLDYKSQSWLSKAGYHLNDEHYVGTVFEHSKQEYTLREMFLSNYHFGPKEENDYIPIFDGISTFSGLSSFTPTRFYIDEHHLSRYGLEYKYQKKQSNSFLDQALVRIDQRKLEMRSTVLSLNCSKWPTVDKNCWPSNQHYIQGQLGKRHDSSLEEKDKRIDFALLKRLKIGSTRHELQLRSGYITSDYVIYNHAYQQFNRDSSLEKNLKNGGDSYSQHGPFNTGKIRGTNIFIGLSDRIKLRPDLDASLALRYDYQSFKANPTPERRKIGMNFERAKYQNLSWDLGLAYRPIDRVQLTYRASSGFRTPSVFELVGPNFNVEKYDSTWQQQGPLKEERSFNHEVGAEFISTAFKISGSYFITEYKNLIGRAASRDSIGQTDQVYQNLYNFTTHGFDIKTSVDLNSIHPKLPEGLEIKFNAGVTRIKKRSPVSKEYELVSDYTFDAIQPLKLVYGLEYHDPDGKWGVSLMTTYSKAKNADELSGTIKQGGLTTQGSRVANIRTRSWRITDIFGYYHATRNVTIRAGVYNIFNYRYVTWESARQTSFGSEARITTGNYTALAAPGRNFLLNLEMKF
ncbi:TonB-dependent hemoglobin/transferrin/lactoferrin family receptor [Basilea psittacipulmonis]|uniref:TonB-dependent receptor n=1 Tax=Basilea psittacipulmonis DSM 24701 TaxID=1072685 RepID=A0A077DBD3_9BURK|nr:TonB-dependent hemoglobin/transferrin/lactoferrin family receptor [Basilea psittacipulmonis]AIL32165.1 hypothetical protein IX83_01465 [Basilea psittacipulmonis DSM 24701]